MRCEPSHAYDFARTVRLNCVPFEDDGGPDAFDIDPDPRRARAYAPEPLPDGAGDVGAGQPSGAAGEGGPEADLPGLLRKLAAQIGLRRVPGRDRSAPEWRSASVSPKLPPIPEAEDSPRRRTRSVPPDKPSPAAPAAAPRPLPLTPRSDSFPSSSSRFGGSPASPPAADAVRRPVSLPSLGASKLILSPRKPTAEAPASVGRSPRDRALRSPRERALRAPLPPSMSLPPPALSPRRRRPTRSLRVRFALPESDPEEAAEADPDLSALCGLPPLSARW
eukprot:tig00000403_g273.t1